MVMFWMDGVYFFLIFIITSFKLLNSVFLAETFLYKLL